MAVGDVGAVFAGVVPDGAEVVIDDVEQNGETAGVAGVDEAF